MSPSLRPTSRNACVPVLKSRFRSRIVPDAPGGVTGTVRSIGRRNIGPVLAPGTLGISMGSGDRRDRGFIGSMPGIPKIREFPDPRRKIPLLGKIIGRNTPPNTRVISTGVMPGELDLPPDPISTGKLKLPPGIAKKMGERKMGLDLGNLIGELGGRYIDAKYGGPVSGPMFQPTVQPWNTPGAFAEGGAIPATPADIPFLDVIPETGKKGMCWDPAGNCGAGKWVRKYRRRRKRLATASDIKDLASLNSVTTPAEKKTWIATHPS